MRQVLWTKLLAMHNLPLHTSINMSTIAMVSEGYTPGGIEQVPLLIKA